MVAPDHASRAFAKAAELKGSALSTPSLRGGESVEAKEARILERAERHRSKQWPLWVSNTLRDLIMKEGNSPTPRPSWAQADPDRLRRVSFYIAERKHQRRLALVHKAADRIRGRHELGR